MTQKTYNTLKIKKGQPLRTSQKKFLRSDEEDYHHSGYACKHHRNHCPFCTEWEAGTVHSSTEELTARKPRYKQAEEEFKCRHCKRFVCPPEYCSHHTTPFPCSLFYRDSHQSPPATRTPTSRH